MASSQVRYEDDALRIVTVDNLFVAAWFNAPSLEQMRVVDRENRAHRAGHDGVGFLNLMLAGVPRFSQEILEEARRQTAVDSMKDLATCHLILLDEMVGSAVRAFMSTVLLLARPKEPNKVFGNPADAARWLAPLLFRVEGPRWDEDKLLAIIEEASVPRHSENGSTRTAPG